MKNFNLKRFLTRRFAIGFLLASIVFFLSTTGLAFFSYHEYQKLQTANTRQFKLNGQLLATQKELSDIKSQDQYVINQKNTEEIKNINATYKKSMDVYEKLLDLKTVSKNTSKYDDALSQALKYLADRNYASAESELNTLSKNIVDEKNKIASSFTIPANTVSSNAPPSSGARTQSVSTDVGTFLVTIISADLNSARVIVDTASDSDCRNDCPVMPLAAYAQRSGAFAAINGPYFCPASYPSCADKKNSFDTLLMNKNKHYFNSDNNVYSVVPAVIFSGSSARFVGRSLEWGRDTGVDSVIAMQPMLVSGGNVAYGDDSEAKRIGKGTRAFIGTTGNMVYIGVVHNATTAEMAHTIKALGIQDAINLDSGGSIALWSNGSYLAGPGRDTPFGILLVRK